MNPGVVAVSILAIWTTFREIDVTSNPRSFLTALAPYYLSDEQMSYT